jgi:uncharacterized protein YbjT (DUF2867 family)
MSYRAVIVGATGAVGSALVGELLCSSACREAIAVTRRPFDAFPGAAKLRVHIVDFERLERATTEISKSCEAAFCTMGIGQPRKVAFDEFWRVDVEYAGAFARGAAAAGVRHISLLSSVGADAASLNPYLRAKGTAERVVEQAGIARTSFFRPSLLVTRKARYGVQDRVTQAVFPIVSPLLPQRYHQVRVEDLARAMRINAEQPGRSGVEVLEYPQFVALMCPSE